MRKTIRIVAVLFLLSLLMAPLTAAAVDNLEQLPSQVREEKEKNEDVVGWLLVPDTDLSLPVVQSADNSYYLRRNLEGQYDFAGSIFADYRCAWGEHLSRNTVLYGNSTTDNPGTDNAQMFDLLKWYWDEEFAKTHPHIYFAGEEAVTLWQVVAVSVVTTELPYSDPDLAQATLEQIRAASLHPYDDVEVGEEDHLLTLSTVDYSNEDSTNTRFVVVAKQVEMEAAGPTEAPEQLESREPGSSDSAQSPELSISDPPGNNNNPNTGR